MVVGLKPCVWRTSSVRCDQIMIILSAAIKYPHTPEGPLAYWWPLGVHIAWVIQKTHVCSRDLLAPAAAASFLSRLPRLVI